MSWVSLKVELPSHSLSFHIQVPTQSTVLDIKREINRTCTGAPRVEGQKIIWRGRVLRDEERVENIWKTPDESRVIHLAVHYSAWSSAPPENPAHSPSSSQQSTSGTTPNITSYPIPPFIPHLQSPPPVNNTQPVVGMPHQSALLYVWHKHAAALGFLMRRPYPLPTVPNMAAARRSSMSLVESFGWTWPSILDEEFPPPGDEESGLHYEFINNNGQRFLSLTNPNATPTPLQIHCLKVLSYTFTIILTPPAYPSALGPYTSVQAYALRGAPADINQHLQRLGLPQIAGNNAGGPAFMAEMRDIPLRALLAPLMMLAIRTLLLLYFISPARKPFIGFIIAAWVVYELWGAVRIAMGYDGNRAGNADGPNGQAQAAPAPGAGADGNAPLGPAPNPMHAMPAQMGGRPRTQGNARSRSHTDMVMDMAARMNLDDEERALTAAPGTQVRPPSLGHKLTTFMGLLVMTLHPELWNRRRARLRQREGRVRTEANAREDNPASGEGEDDTQREERQRRQRAREDLIAQHHRRPLWVREYIERVRRNEWVDE